MDLQIILKGENLKMKFKTKTRSSKPFYKRWWFIGIVAVYLLGSGGLSDDTDIVSSEGTTESQYEEQIHNDTQAQESTEASTKSLIINSESIASNSKTEKVKLSQKVMGVSSTSSNAEYYEFNGIKYKIITVDGGNTSGHREKNVAVDIGFGDRVYWGLTNEYGQLVHVIASEIFLQDDRSEPVNSDGRYYDEEANVPGTELPDLDQGHVIADSLGGVANAYNITPQDSTLNRHGDQAYMEKVIRDAGGCQNFIATITYASTNTQIPLKYKFEYEIFGDKIVDEFDNVNPDKVNATINTTEATTNPPVIALPAPTEAPTSSFNEAEEVRKIDTNGNGQVTIKEAKAAGFSMPIYSSHWLYKYMDDRDGDGMVGE